MTDGAMREAAFTTEQIALLGGALGEEDVLVGGQALVFWSMKYGLLDGEADGSMLTLDADILGFSPDTVSNIARQMNGTAAWPPAKGFGTALYGLVKIGLADGSYLNVDVLRTVAGVDLAKAAKRTARVIVGGQELNVLHPVDVFSSKIYNLSRFAGKQDAKGIRQAMLAVQVVRSYLSELSRKNPEKSAKVAVEIFKIGKSSTGLGVRRFGIDPFDALDELDVANRNFMEINLPRIREAIGKIRMEKPAKPDDPQDDGEEPHWEETGLR